MVLKMPIIPNMGIRFLAIARPIFGQSVRNCFSQFRRLLSIDLWWEIMILTLLKIFILLDKRVDLLGDGSTVISKTWFQKFRAWTPTPLNIPPEKVRTPAWRMYPLLRYAVICSMIWLHSIIGYYPSIV